jgi:thioredoxin 1
MIQINFTYNMKRNTFASMLKPLSFVALFLVFTSCKNNSSNGKLDVQAFNQIASNNNAQIIDLRPKSVFDSGHIENAASFAPNSQELEAYVDLLYKDVPVCVVGGNEGENAKLIDLLKSKGFKSINELDGGMLSWQKANLPILKTEPKKVYPNDTIAFDDAILGKKLVMVDFNATWCKPCKMMQPSIDKVHDTRSEEVIVYSIDVDQFPQYNEKYQIKSIPLVLLFKNGQILHRSEGLLEESKINELIDKNK